MLHEDIVREPSAGDAKPLVLPSERLGHLVQPFAREGILSTDVDCSCGGARETRGKGSLVIMRLATRLRGRVHVHTGLTPLPPFTHARSIEGLRTRVV